MSADKGSMASFFIGKSRSGGLSSRDAAVDAVDDTAKSTVLCSLLRCLSTIDCVQNPCT